MSDTDTHSKTLPAVATGLGGFSLGLFTQLGVPQILQLQNSYAVLILAFVAAIVLVVGRATIAMPDATARRVVNIMIGVCVLITFFGLYRFFYPDLHPVQIIASARFLPDISKEPTLKPRIMLANANVDLTDAAESIVVHSGDRIDVDIKNLSTIVGELNSDRMSIKDLQKKLRCLTIAQSGGATGNATPFNLTQCLLES